MTNALLSHEKFERALRMKKLTQEEFAEEIGVSDRQVRNWKKRNVNVSISTCHRIAVAFDVPIEELLILVESNE